MTQKGIPKTKINEISNLASKYDSSPQGFMRAVTEHGGTDMLNKALSLANSPLAKVMLPMFGIDKNKIEDFKNDLKGLNSGGGNQTTPSASSYLERLKNLK